MRVLTDIPDDELKGRRVLVRAGLDVPVADGKVAGDFRVQSAVPTLRYLSERGAKVIVISHIGRDPNESLAPVAAALNGLIPLTFVPSLLDETVRQQLDIMNDGDIVVLENLRQHQGETGNDPAFAQKLAAYGDLYVNDAFSVCHREHASIVQLPKLLPAAAGIEVAAEVAHLAEALAPQAPSLCILAGAKFETKEPLIRKLLGSYDHVFVGGALANDIFKARGLEVGRSKISDGVPSADVLGNPKLIAPADVSLTHADGSAAIAAADAIGADDMVMDMGPQTLEELKPLIGGAKMILWNGPTGIYEKGYEHFSIELAKLIADSSGHSVVGGGDTVTAIAHAGLMDRFTFVSTGGGAMLEYLLNGTLPGIDALR
ncbi:MAG TPA: phosphoglycerate kinase [Candidatus Paceibacterota bacterium]|nr:phosphoglycerate kinase [Candidatus Paceibacterota bacterium]